MRFPRPTPALVVAMLALLVALGGTAVATIQATGTATNIVDPTTATRIAKVDAAGKLYVGDGVGNLTVDGLVTAAETPPRTQFRHHVFVSEGIQNLTPATSATLALSRIAVAAHGDTSLAFPATVYLYRRGASGGTCSGGLGSPIGQYSVKPNETVLDPLPVAMLLKPPTGSPEWCLASSTTIVGDAGSYYLPGIFLTGYVVSGSYAGVAASEAASENVPTTPPRSDG